MINKLYIYQCVENNLDFNKFKSVCKFFFGSKIIHESRQLLNGADLDGYHSDKQSPDTTQLSPTPFLSPPGVSGSPLQVSAAFTAQNFRMSSRAAVPFYIRSIMQQFLMHNLCLKTVKIRSQYQVSVQSYAICENLKVYNHHCRHKYDKTLVY